MAKNEAETEELRKRFQESGEMQRPSGSNGSTKAIPMQRVGAKTGANWSAQLSESAKHAKGNGGVSLGP